MAEATKTQATNKKPNINLPAKFLLTDEGLGYFAKRNIPVRDLITSEGRRKSGFHWQNFKASLVQKMVVNRLLGMIDIDRAEFLSKREEVIDVTKLLVYGILYKKFKPTLNKILFESQIIEQIRKSSGRKVLSPDFKFNPKIVDHFMATNAETIKTLKELLLIDPYAIIEQDTDMNKRDKEEKKKIVQRFIEQVDDNTWFLLHFVSKSKGRFEVIDKINQVLLSYVKKTKIADYMAFMIMELIQNAEKAHFEKIATVKKLLGPEEPIDEYLKTKSQRKKLEQIAAKSQQFINLNYKFEGDALNISSRIKLQIMITNKGIMIEKTKRDLRKKMKSNTREQSLAQFYSGDHGEKLGAGLGLYYLSYLEDACKEEKMNFEARIVADDRREETSVLITLYI